jgi:hypothetical protein
MCASYTNAAIWRDEGGETVCGRLRRTVRK